MGRTPSSAADPPVGLYFPEKITRLAELSRMSLYCRRLPHDHETDQPVFLTWRLHDSLPPNRPFPAANVNSGQAFAAMDRLLDEAHSGPLYLRQPAIAGMVVEAIQYNAAKLDHYVLHAFVVMPTTCICWPLPPWPCPI